MQTRTLLGAGTGALVLALLGTASPAPALGPAASTQPAPAAAGPAGVFDGAERAVIGRRIIGRSVRDRPIRAFHLGEPQARRTVVVIGAMHGNEEQSARPLAHLRDHQPVTGVDLWVIPVLNPDGFVRGNRRNARGVDLNRNFPVGWRDLDGTYESGPRPKSEPETRAVLRFLRRIDPDRMISLHQPLFAVDAKNSKNPRFSRRVARAMQLPISNVDCGGVCHGTMTMWFNRRLDGASITAELSASPSTMYLKNTAPNGILSAVGGSR